MKRIFIYTVCYLLTVNCLFAQTGSNKTKDKHVKSKSAKAKPATDDEKERAKDEDMIRTMLAAQVKEWNKGSIEGFMIGYWDNDSMLFIGSKGPKYGYQKTLERYEEAYPDKEKMGKLISTIVKMQRLSKEYYFVVGKWELKRNSDDLSGSFTLLIRKIDSAWVIVCDHSS